MENKLIPTGNGTFVAKERILSIGAPGTAPLKRLVGEYEKRNKLIDFTYGKTTRSFIFMDNGTVIRSTIAPETISTRFNHEE